MTNKTATQGLLAPRGKTPIRVCLGFACANIACHRRQFPLTPNHDGLQRRSIVGSCHGCHSCPLCEKNEMSNVHHHIPERLRPSLTQPEIENTLAPCHHNELTADLSCWDENVTQLQNNSTGQTSGVFFVVFFCFFFCVCVCVCGGGGGGGITISVPFSALSVLEWGNPMRRRLHECTRQLATIRPAP